MTNEDFAILVDCIEAKKRDNDETFYVVKEDTPKHIKVLLKEVLFDFDDNINSLDQAYEMLNDALNALMEVPDLEALKEFDIGETDTTHASVYIADRLSYITVHNQDEITEKVREYGCDIQEAAAYWYDEQVNSLIEDLKTKILEA